MVNSCGSPVEERLVSKKKRDIMLIVAHRNIKHQLTCLYIVSLGTLDFSESLVPMIALIGSLYSLNRNAAVVFHGICMYIWDGTYQGRSSTDINTITGIHSPHRHALANSYTRFDCRYLLLVVVSSPYQNARTPYKLHVKIKFKL